MKKLLTTILISLLAITCMATTGALNARIKKTSFCSTKTYKPHAIKTPSLHKAQNSTPKAPYAGLGKKSSVTGIIKTKITRGYVKPSNGYKFVNPYARS